MSLEQALSIGGNEGQTTIQIPASQLTDGHIMVDGNQLKFTVEQVSMPGQFFPIHSSHCFDSTRLVKVILSHY